MLLQGQAKLPRLPVPDLEATVARYLKSLQPLFSGHDLARNESLARDFLASSVSQTLQQLLRERDAREPNSWLETWWNRLAYLEYRESSVINVNFAMPFRSFPEERVSQARRAALIVRGALNYKDLVDSRTLTPDPQPYDQLPHTRIFNCCRVPESVSDVQARYPEPNDLVVCICRDMFWVLEKTAQASVSSLESAFSSILAEAGASSLDLGPGIMTFMHRDKWTEGRKRLIALGNDATLDAIQRCAFVVCLDEGAPESKDQIFDLSLMGDSTCCSNRWFDKPLQFIVFRNGEAALNGEHSPVDGEPVARIMDYVLDNEQALNKQSGAAEQKVSARKLIWRLDEGVRRLMREGLKVATEQISNLGTKQLVFDAFGKEAIRGFKVSPDAWAQAALQLAHFRLHGRFAPTYESASTRRYLAGRTETGRTLTPELAQFCRAPSRAGLEEAARAHVAYMRDAGLGRGCDRHLLALRLLASEHGLSHPFLSDPAMAASSHWRLSTSQLAVRNIFVGFGPVVPDGYGVCYQIHPHRLHFCVTHFKSDKTTDAVKLAAEIERALFDMRNLFVGAKL